MGLDAFKSIVARLQTIAELPETSATTSSTAVAQSAPWHLQARTGGTVGINAVSVWQDYTGKGIKVGVFDEGVNAGNTDLTSALLNPLSSNSNYGRHGTAVAGLIAASPNGMSPVGVAYEAKVADVPIIGLTLANLTANMKTAVNYDITNNSWGWNAAFYSNEKSASFAGFFQAIADAAEQGRGGLGTVQVVASGNSKASGGDSNVSNFVNDEHVIAVGAITSEGTLTSYANGGAAILVAAPSGGGTRGLTSTDIPGLGGYDAGDVTNSFSGTSGATPIVSGVVALMLEANPYLGWRDVKSILAMSAQQVSGISATTNAAGNWNGGGMLFTGDIGYGVVDARAAVRLAETWVSQETSANQVKLTASVSDTQALKDFTSVSYSFTMGAGESVETAALSLDGSHKSASDLVVELISPNGTISRLLSNDAAGTAFSGFTLTSNAFLGESSEGTWTVRITDNIASGSGTVSGATLTLFGAADTANDTYVYTDAYGSLAGANRTTLSDTGGRDVLNAAALSTGALIDLTPGAVSTLAGRGLTIGAGTTIEVAMGGDGADKIIGNAVANVLYGGRGNDSLFGQAGDDVLVGGQGNDALDGGAGVDTAVQAGKKADWSFSLQSGNLLTLTAAGESDTLTSVERIAFDDGLYGFDVNGSLGTAYRLYKAAFDRTPDTAGLAYWVNALDTGASAEATAAGFVNSQEFRNLFGGNSNTVDFVTKLYANVLDRAPDAAGLAGWVKALDAGTLDRATTLNAFAQSTENRNALDHVIATGVLLGDPLTV